MHYVIKNGYGKYWNDGTKMWWDKDEATQFTTYDKAEDFMYLRFSAWEIANFVIVPV